MTLTAIGPVAIRPDSSVSVPLIPRQPRVKQAVRTDWAVPVVDAVPCALPITTVRQGARVAIHRTRRFTLLGHVPFVGSLVVPWLWPLHMLIVGLTAGHIRQTPDASLSYCDGSRPRRHVLILAT